MQNLVFWNYNKTNKDYPEFNFWPNTQHYWKMPIPIMVAFPSIPAKFIASQLKYEESNGTKFYPESLYECQLKSRLSKLHFWKK